MRLTALVVVTLVALILVPLLSTAAYCADGAASAEEVFEQRIMPIFKSPNPSSCVQCHLASVDLKDYIRPSCEETFVALRAQGLIDLDSPEASKILTLIEMGESDADKTARLIHAKSRAAEFTAFKSWIVACCNDPKYRDLEIDAERPITAGPRVSDEVIRHSRKDRVLDSFVRNVWSQRMRCFPCHTPNEIDLNNPQHEVPAQRHREYVEQYGQRMNIFRDSPEGTMKALIASSRKTHKDSLPLINFERPAQSLLVLKPTAKIPPKGPDGEHQKPSSVVPVTHGGGLKMHVDDLSYKAFMSWIIDLAQITNGEYRSVEELPADNWVPTNHVIRINAAPADWPALCTVQLFVHAWDATSETFSSHPVAFTQTKVTPRGLAVGTLFLIVSDKQLQADEVESQKLNPGKYEIRAYLDSEQRLQHDATLLLNDRECTASVQVDAQWREGFPQAEAIDGSRF